MKWYKVNRSDGRIEHVCEHGVGHPDVREHMYHPSVWKRIGSWLGIHGCDGCCNRDDFPGRQTDE